MREFAESPAVRGLFNQFLAPDVRTEPWLQLSVARRTAQAPDQRGPHDEPHDVRSVSHPGPMGDACAAIDDHLSAAGYAQYSRPPFIRRRGHGLGGGSFFPGDVAVDNKTILEPGMVFVLHPNQFLPETGYMMCGEPLLVTRDGVEILSRKHASLLLAREETIA